MATLRRAVFLDRDGTLNRMVHYEDHGIVDSPFLPSQLELVEGAGKALVDLRKKGFMLVVISNQPGMAKGTMSKKNFLGIDRRFDTLLKKEGAWVDAKYYCIHHPDAKLKSLRSVCGCRKPKPGMIKKAARDLGIDIHKSYFVGDGVVDVRAGRAAGCKTVFVGAFKPELWKLIGKAKAPDIVAKNIASAARKIR